MIRFMNRFMNRFVIRVSGQAVQGWVGDRHEKKKGNWLVFTQDFCLRKKNDVERDDKLASASLVISLLRACRPPALPCCLHGGLRLDPHALGLACETVAHKGELCWIGLPVASLDILNRVDDSC